MSQSPRLAGGRGGARARDDTAEVGAPRGEGRDAAAAAAMRDLGRELSALRRHAETDPFGNPIQLLALRIGRWLDAGALSREGIADAIARLTAQSFERRAERLGAYLGERDEATNRAAIEHLVRRLAGVADGGDPVPFEDFQRAIERPRFGIVITAHPTFACPRPLQEILVTLATGTEADGTPLGEPRRRALLEEAAAADHCPDAPPTLADEHDQSTRALANLHGALERVHGVVLEVAATLYPDRWQALRPSLITLASWVGYDLDGRSDIPWTATFAKRLRVQILQLGRYRRQLAALRAAAEADGGTLDLLDLLDARLALAIKQADDEAAVFSSTRAGSSDWRHDLARAARAMHAGRDARLVSARPLLNLVERAIRQARDPDLERGLCVMRATLSTHGLGLAHTHVRINARQLHNAIRKTIGMDHPPDDPSYRLSYLNAVAALIERVQPERINFGSLLDEKATAKRVFMIIAQMRKYVDADQPVRFLIAETETGFTILTALYFARLFDVADGVDISPLFETQTGLEQAGRILAEALEVAAFRDHVRRRGRLCIQTGFSDSGRSIGQIAAAHLIEQLRVTAACQLETHGLRDVELVIFDTHGESIGRGGHPGSFADRLAYIDSDHSRAAIADLGVACKQETSFQGGDGYLYFLSEPAAFITLTRILEHVLSPPDRSPDPFYVEADYVHEFFAAIRHFNQRTMDDPSYGALLGAYGANMLPASGSRPAKRQHDSPSGQIKPDHPAQLRAIPHNGILHQLGYLANTIGGVGAAVAKDPEAFQRLYDESPRFRRLMTMVEHAFKFSDLAVLKAYIDVFDPGLWLLRAAQRGEGRRAEDLEHLAEVMERAGLHQRLTRIWRIFTRDHMALAAALREHRRRARRAGTEPIVVDSVSRDVMHQLNALRLALIQELYLLAIHVPEFSARHDVTRESLIARLVQLDVEPALEQLAEIFPIVELDGIDEDFGEPATYRSADNPSYAAEHAHIFQPMGALHRLIRQVSAAVTHNVGTLG